MDNQMNTPQTPTPNYQNPKRKVNPHIIWGIVVVILVVALGWLSYDTMQKNAEMSELDTELTEVRENLETVTAENAEEVEEEPVKEQEEPAVNPDTPVSNETGDDIYVGIASVNANLNSANIETLYEDVGPEKFHLEYGTMSEQLNQTTTPTGKERLLGPDVEPGLRIYGLYVDGLEADQRYFYKIVATTADGDEIKSDLASFRTGK